MGYAQARHRGLPIGSGTVEAACKSLVALRMKRPGARWKEPSGQHILDLRALLLSERWQPAMELALAPLQGRYGVHMEPVHSMHSPPPLQH
jgi:hypothetical protein